MTRMHRLTTPSTFERFERVATLRAHRVWTRKHEYVALTREHARNMPRAAHHHHHPGACARRGERARMGISDGDEAGGTCGVAHELRAILVSPPV